MSFREECEVHARNTMSKARAHDFIERVKGRGQYLATFYLPNSLCKTANATRTSDKRAHTYKDKVRNIIAVQAMATGRGIRAQFSIPGRPHLIIVRFSSRAPDQSANGHKAAVDALVKINWLRDDSPKHVRIDDWWEPAPKGKGFTMIEVWDGVSEAEFCREIDEVL